MSLMIGASPTATFPSNEVVEPGSQGDGAQYLASIIAAPVGRPSRSDSLDDEGCPKIY
jgi:hypothetical protein